MLRRILAKTMFNRVHPIPKENSNKPEAIISNDVVMNVFENKATDSTERPLRSSDVHAHSNVRYHPILTAIENWNLKKIISINNSLHFNADDVFLCYIPSTLKSQMAPLFWDSLQNCNFLHYAALHRATRIIKTFLTPTFGFDINSTTQEGVTALHISAALGDFFTVQMLLSSGANTEIQDENGRTALHYAVQTNIEVCLILTRGSTMDMNLEDKNAKSIIEIAKVANKPFIPEFVEGVEKKVNQYWIPQHIFQFECESISPSADDESQCECGQNINHHNSVFQKYDIGENDFVEKPTDVYGEIEFSRLYKCRPYVRLSKNTSLEILMKLLIEQWQIEKPSLIISIYGSDFEGHAIREILKKGIWKSAGNEGTFVWIITNGIASNLIQVVGEAIRDFTDAYGEDQLYALALFPWNFHSKIDFLCSQNYLGHFPTEYQKPSTKDTKPHLLEQNHSHYIFLDIPKIMNQTKSYIDYRLEFENAVANIEELIPNAKISKETVPICGILICGSRDDIRLLHGSLVKNGKPSVIIKGSGGVANLISELLDEINSKNRKRKTLEEALSKDNIKGMMIELWNVLEDFDEEISLVKEIIENRHLIEIFSLEEDLPTELDKKILSSLLSQDKASLKNRDSLNISQLNTALSINRCDVAKEKIFTEGKKWKVEDLNPLVSKSIAENKVGFVKLFVEKGFSMSKIITVDFVEHLYTVDIFNASKPVRILSQGLRMIKFKKGNKKVTLLDIGGVLKLLLGDLYYPLYLRASFQETLNSKLPFERPIRELFIWSLLTQRMELAQFIWTLETEAIAAALFAANLLRSMVTLTDVISDKEDLSHWAEIFEDKAEGVVEECYKENPDNTRENLTRELIFYGKATYLELAADGDSIKFIAHRSCQELLDSIWRYSLDDTTKSWEFVTYMIVGITFPFILPFVVHYKPFFYVSENNSNTSNKRTSGMKKVVNNKNEDKALDSTEILLRGIRRSNMRVKIYFRKLFDFYSTPVIKFSYTIFFYLMFVLYFTFLNLTGIHVKNLKTDLKWLYIVLIIWTVSLSIEEVRQAFGSGISFKAYISDIWNKIDILSYIFFILGTFGIILTLCDPIAKIFTFSILDIQPMVGISTTLLRFAKFAYGFSIFLFTIRILQYFSINVYMGPIIVMIRNMLANDLGPFMAILVTIIISYGTLLWSINFEVKSNLQMEELPRILYAMLRTIYFQLFGDLRMDILRGENMLPECTQSNLMCPDIWGVWIGPVIAAMYMVLSSVLMLNLLIAIFSNTYEIIQSSATQYWTLERYHLMRQSSNRPSVAPPFIIIWQFFYILTKFLPFSIEQKNPFKTNYINLPIKEKQLIQWEHMRAIDYIRSFDDLSKKNKGNTTLVVNKGNTSLGSLGNMKKDLELIRNEIVENFKERFSNLENRLQKLEVVEDNVISILEFLKQMKIPNCVHHMSEGLMKSSSKYNLRNTGTDEFEDRYDEGFETSARFWYINIQDHHIFRLVPLINNTHSIKKELINENEASASVRDCLNKDPVDEFGVPVNPHKNINKIGKDFLPFWGSNHCIHILITRWKRDERDNIIKRLGRPILQIVGISQNNQTEIPFVFVQHNASCLVNSCSSDLLKGIIKDYINSIANEETSNNSMNLENNFRALNNVTINEIYRGYIDDFRNTDNSWMETVAFNIQQIYSLEFSTSFIKKMTKHKAEKATWIDVSKERWTNPSNIELLSILANYHDALF